jgi:hypothetical protein
MMGLALFDGCNYVLRRESPETQCEFVQHGQGKVTTGWEMMVPPPGPDGVPYQIIFVGPTPEHRGSAIRLSMVTTDDATMPEEAEVLLETYYKTGTERTVMFQGIYKQFKAIPDQHAANAAVALQKRAEAGEDYVIRLTVTVPADGPQPDPTADKSFFELECVKLWWQETA